MQQLIANTFRVYWNTVLDNVMWFDTSNHRGFDTSGNRGDFEGMLGDKVSLKEY